LSIAKPRLADARRFDPTKPRGAERLEARPLSEVEAEFGAWRPFPPPTNLERDTLTAAFELAGRNAVGSIASVLD
jgi:hypothetical protein